MSNRAWERRRTKQGICARQYGAVQRKMRRALTAKQPLPITVSSTGVGGTKLTMTLGPADDDIIDGDDWPERWEDQ